MRIGVVIVLLAAVSACSARGLFRQYEYEEEMYLSLDGSATIYVNTSVPALVALRGAPLDASPTAAVDRAAVREYFTSPTTRVASVRTSRRRGRRFVHVRVDADDVRRLSGVGPFDWSTYQFKKDGEFLQYLQRVGSPSNATTPSTAWDGREVVAFRMHLPSRVVDTNIAAGVQRGNILEAEQLLTDRLRGVPIALEVRMEPQSILSRTLLLFLAAMAAVALTFGAVIWWIRSAGGAERG
jgi:hypothetical protein